MQKMTIFDVLLTVVPLIFLIAQNTSNIRYLGHNTHQFKRRIENKNIDVFWDILIRVIQNKF